ncbi:MAG: hypothetical protein ABIN83_08475 [Sphingomicrobium sp.]
MSNFLILCLLGAAMMFAVIGVIAVLGSLNPRLGKRVMWPLLIGLAIGIVKSGEIVPVVTGALFVLCLFLGAVAVRKRKIGA